MTHGGEVLREPSSAAQREDQDTKKKRKGVLCFPSSSRWGDSLSKNVGVLQRTLRRRFGRSRGPRDTTAATTEVVVQQICPQASNAQRLLMTPADPSDDAAASPKRMQPEAQPGLTNIPEPPKLKTFPELLAESVVHMHVLSAARLMPARLSGESDPYCVVQVGCESYRTKALPDTLNPQWNETFSFRGSIVGGAGMIVAFEVWSSDDFHPDPFLGQAELDLRTLPWYTTSALAPIRYMAPLKCTLTLYALKASGKKEKDDFGELTIALFLTPESEDKPMLAPVGTVRSMNLNKGKVSDVCKKHKILPSVVHNALGTLYEEPCVVYLRLAIQHVVIVPEHHSCTGTQIAACKITRAAKTVSMQLQKWTSTSAARGDASSPGSGLPINRSGGAFSSSPGTGGSATGKSKGKRGFGVFSLPEGSAVSEGTKAGGEGDRDDHDEFDVDVGLDAEETELPFEQPQGSSSQGIGFKTLGSFWNSDDASSSAQAESVGERSLCGSGSNEMKPRYAYLKVQYAQQSYTSRMVRLDNATGSARIQQDFVFADVRPLVSRPLGIAVYVTKDKERAGRLVGLFTEDVTEVLRNSIKAENDGLGLTEEKDAAIKKKTMAANFQLPLLTWPMDTPYSGSLSMHLGVADADWRPFIYGIPLLPEKPGATAQSAPPLAATQSTTSTLSPAAQSATITISSGASFTPPAKDATSALTTTSATVTASSVPAVSSLLGLPASTSPAATAATTAATPGGVAATVAADDQGRAESVGKDIVKAMPSSLQTVGSSITVGSAVVPAGSSTVVGGGMTGRVMSGTSTSGASSGGSGFGFGALAQVPEDRRAGSAGTDGSLGEPLLAGRQGTRTMSERGSSGGRGVADQESRTKGATGVAGGQGMQAEVAGSRAVESWLRQVPEEEWVKGEARRAAAEAKAAAAAAAVARARGVGPDIAGIDADASAKRGLRGTLAAVAKRVRVAAAWLLSLLLAALSAALAALARLATMLDPRIPITVDRVWTAAYSHFQRHLPIIVAAVAEQARHLASAIASALPDWTPGSPQSPPPRLLRSLASRRSEVSRTSHTSQSQSAPSAGAGQGNTRNATLGPAAAANSPHSSLTHHANGAGAGSGGSTSSVTGSSPFTSPFAPAATTALAAANTTSPAKALPLPGPPAGPRTTPPLNPVGILNWHITDLTCTLPDVYHFTVLKCGPHWIRTPLHKSGNPIGDWRIAIPIYSPGVTVAGATFYQKSLTSKPADVQLFCRMFVHTNNIPPNTEIKRRIVRYMMKPGGEAPSDRKGVAGSSAAKVKKAGTNKDQHPGTGGNAARRTTGGSTAESVERHGGDEASSAAPGKGAGKGTIGNAGNAGLGPLGIDHDSDEPRITMSITVRMDYHDWKELLAAYVRPERPDAWYALGLDAAHQEQLEKQHNQIISRWLERSHPSIPPGVVKDVLRHRRRAFTVAQTKANVERVKRGLGLIKAALSGLDHLQSWETPLHSYAACAIMVAFAFRTSLTLACLVLWLMKVIYDRRHLAGQPPYRHSLGAGYVEEEELDAPSKSALAKLRKNYKQAVSVALLAQNLLDDVAVFFERVYGVASWADPAATTIAMGILALAAGALYLLGIRLLVAAAGLYLLRPPAYRDPMPSPPEALFARLPAALGCCEDLSHTRTYVANVTEDEPEKDTGAEPAAVAANAADGKLGA